MAETNSPFLKKGSAIFRVIVFISLPGLNVLSDTCYFIVVSKGNESMSDDIKKTPLCSRNVHRGVLKLTKGVRAGCTQGYSEARYRLSMAECRTSRAASSTTRFYSINHTESTHVFMSPHGYAEGCGRYNKISFLPHSCDIVGVTRSVNLSISGTMVVYTDGCGLVYTDGQVDMADMTALEGSNLGQSRATSKNVIKLASYRGIAVGRGGCIPLRQAFLGLTLDLLEVVLGQLITKLLDPKDKGVILTCPPMELL